MFAGSVPRGKIAESLVLFGSLLLSGDFDSYLKDRFAITPETENAPKRNLESETGSKKALLSFFGTDVWIGEIEKLF